MKSRDLTEGNILKLLLVVAIPTILTGLLRFSYNFLDMWFIGQYSSEKGIASIGSASLYITYGYAINFLTITGLGIKLSHSLGRKDMNDFNKYLNVGLALNTSLSFLTSFVFFVFAKPLISLVGLQDPQVIADSVMYLRIFAVVFIFSFFNGVANRVMLSMGKSDESLKINVVGILINIVLDPIFIFVLDLNVIGAGIATLIAEITVTIIYLVRNKETFSIKKSFGFETEYLKDILNLSAPYFFQRLLFNFIGFRMGAKWLFKPIMTLPCPYFPSLLFLKKQNISLCSPKTNLFNFYTKLYVYDTHIITPKCFQNYNGKVKTRLGL